MAPIKKSKRVIFYFASSILLFTLSNFTTNAQVSQEVKVHASLTDHPNGNTEGFTDSNIIFMVNPNQEDRRLSYLSYADLHEGSEKDYVSIHFINERNEFMKMQDVGLQSVDIIIRNHKINTINISPIALGKDTIIYIPLRSIKGTENNEIVQIVLNIQNGSIIVNPSPTLFFKYRKKITPYGAFNSNLHGLWFPVGMFATNFNRTTNGITFAPTPIGIAAGFKCNSKSNKFYLGFSGYASWLIYQSQDSTKKSITFSGLSLGALVDFGNYITIGYGYGLDLTSNRANPGSLFIVGISPGILNFLKSSSK